MDKLQEKIRKQKNPSMVELIFDLEKIPPHLLEQEANEILACERYFRELLDALKALIPAIRLNMGSFSLWGPDGLFLMSRTASYAKELGYYVLLDVPQNLSAESANRAVKQLFSPQSLWQFDGLVVSAYAGSDVLKPYVKAAGTCDKDVFVVLRTANKSAAELQDLLTGSRLVHTAAADIAHRLGEPLVGRSGYSQVAAIGPASVSDILKKLRARYKSMFLLLDGYDYTYSNAKNCSYAFDALGHGAIACTSFGVTAAWQTAGVDSEDYLTAAIDAAERMKKNLLRYVTVL